MLTVLNETKSGFTILSFDPNTLVKCCHAPFYDCENETLKWEVTTWKPLADQQIKKKNHPKLVFVATDFEALTYFEEM